MADLPESALIVLYDRDCGFCKVILAALLSWDRARRLTPSPIQSPDGEELLFDMTPSDRLASWHLIDGAGVVHSAGDGIPLVFAALPGGSAIARLASQFPKPTSLLYEWVAAHRAMLGRPLSARVRAWASRVIAERTSVVIRDRVGDQDAC
ncbi:MAG TPA: DCC1-like thiol-disulfide oxidoreductase family protein [Solirubrobacteraceae bacterium]|nr:DCC1-like thiol-disulfide oxidoreductase family protein [Solirubrobacteraceae bacterium]